MTLLTSLEQLRPIEPQKEAYVRERERERERESQQDETGSAFDTSEGLKMTIGLGI